MDKVWFLFLLLIIVVSGCTSLSNSPIAQFGSISIGDILKNTTKYESKEIMISGKLVQSLGIDRTNYLRDDQGYEMRLANCDGKNRVLDSGATYLGKGTLSCISICICVSEIKYDNAPTDLCPSQTFKSPTEVECKEGFDTAKCSISGKENKIFDGSVHRYCESKVEKDCTMSCTEPLTRIS